MNMVGPHPPGRPGVIRQVHPDGRRHPGGGRGAARGNNAENNFIVENNYAYSVKILRTEKILRTDARRQPDGDADETRSFLWSGVGRKPGRLS